jgi:D-alanyl-D-alanine carboxypeptidase
MESPFKKFLLLFSLVFCLITFQTLLPAWGSTAFNEDNLENISAVSAVVLDGNTGKILYAKNPHLKIPPASTVKLVTAMVVLDNLSLDTKVKISRHAAQTLSVGPTLYRGEVYTVKDLLYLMLMKSSNQAAVALAEAVAGSEDRFAILMNKKVESLGLKESHFVTASGLPAPDQYTTSYELAVILYEAMKYPLIRKIIHTPVKIITSLSGRTLVIRNTNKLLKVAALKDEILGGKTGYTRASRHCLVNGVKINGRLIITSVMGAPSRQDLWKDSLKLIKFSKLVLERKVSPVLITTTINTNILASQKIINPYYKYRYKRRYYKRRYYKRKHTYKRHSRHKRKSRKHYHASKKLKYTKKS